MKQLLLICTCALTFATAHSQISVGAKAGSSLTSIGGKDVDSYNSKFGFYAGGFVQIPVTKSFSVQPELFYSAEGAKWDGTDGKSAFNYLRLPVMAKYTTAFGLFAETGPSLGYLVKATDTDNGDSYSVKDNLKKFDLSWSLGVGYNITPKLGVNARYSTSLTPYYHEERNASVMVGVSWKLLEL